MLCHSFSRRLSVLARAKLDTKTFATHSLHCPSSSIRSDCTPELIGMRAIKICLPLLAPELPGLPLRLHCDATIKHCRHGGIPARTTGKRGPAFDLPTYRLLLRGTLHAPLIFKGQLQDRGCARSQRRLQGDATLFPTVLSPTVIRCGAFLVGIVTKIGGQMAVLEMSRVHNPKGSE